MSSRNAGTFRQCELRKGESTQVAWLPERFAVLGRFVELKGDNGWRVAALYGTRQGAPVETVLESIEPRKR